jgi:hypothetical protein
VDVGDMKRMWEHETKRQSESSTSWADSTDGLEAHPPAVSARVTLLLALLRTRFLDPWRDGDRPSDSVFETLATFPIPEGIENFRPEEFVNTLRNAV